MFQTPFVRKSEEYKRNINPTYQYFHQAAAYLSLMTNRDYEECMKFVRRVITNKEITQVVDPKVAYLERQPNGDRELKETTLTEYISTALKEGDLIAPTLTTYTNPRIKESLLVNYVEDNIAARSVAKKAEFAAKAAGDKEKSKIFNIEQTNKKLRNNALSGAHVSASTPLYNKTAHSTLTSACRTTSGYGNANNEKFLNGNRHYWCANIVINNIISIITHTDYEELERIVKKYNITIPSAEDVNNAIKYSTDLYWSDSQHFKKISDFVNKLNDLQRAAFIYTGDMYHLMKFNQELIRNMIRELSTKVKGECENALKTIKEVNSDYVDLAHAVCYSEMKGKGKNYQAMENTPELNTLVLTSINIGKTLDKYSDLIKVFWVTNNLPGSVGYFPESIRRSAITSDTDSTIFTVQDWVSWYKGEINFDDEAMAVSAIMIFLASQTITNVLATMSANFGMVGKRLFQIAMKNEFKFDAFIVTNVAKHYYAKISIQEGNVFKDREREIKGVHLKSSNSPLIVTKKANELMEFVMESILTNKKIAITNILKDIADVERSIKSTIFAGGLDYFRLSQIKTPDSYTREERESPYIHYLLWEEVFAEKYGHLAPPPYSCIKINTTLNNATATKVWLDEMQDQVLAMRLRQWLAKNNKVYLPTFYLSTDISKSTGIPKEVQDIINVRKIILDLCNVFYIILESIGYYIKTGHMVSDYY
jgi:hypothetical protein